MNDTIITINNSICREVPALVIEVFSFDFDYISIEMRKYFDSVGATGCETGTRPRRLSIYRGL